MSGTSVGRAIDYLVTQITALPECASPVIVSDGYTARRGAQMVWVGVTSADGTSDVKSDWAGIGAQREDETFDIPMLIEQSAGGGDVAVKVVRDRALVILDAINAKIRTDRSLGGALTLPGWAAVRDVRLTQTADPEEAGEGRFARVFFVVRCTARF